MGQRSDIEHVQALIARHGFVHAADAARRRLDRSWNATLDSVHVRTPDGSLDTLINRWLIYHAVSCRL